MNKRIENGIEKKRHRHEYDDVDQITQSTRSANSSGMLDLVFRHPLDTYCLSDRHCKNRSPFSSRNDWRSPRRGTVRRLLREQGDNFFEARIAAKQIPIRVQAQPTIV